MEVIVERLLVELVAIAVQLAIMRLVSYLRSRSSPVDTVRSVAAAA